MACMMEIGYLDGVNPALVCWLKNRNADKSFNSLMVAYGYAGEKASSSYGSMMPKTAVVQRRTRSGLPMLITTARTRFCIWAIA